jgi:hypothetical protein
MSGGKAKIIAFEGKVGMTSYRTILLAGAVILSATSAYASGGKSGIAIRDDMRLHPAHPAGTQRLEGHTSQGTLAPYASERAASRNAPAQIHQAGPRHQAPHHG